MLLSDFFFFTLKYQDCGENNLKLKTVLKQYCLLPVSVFNISMKTNRCVVHWVNQECSLPTNLGLSDCLTQCVFVTN